MRILIGVCICFAASPLFGQDAIHRDLRIAMQKAEQNQKISALVYLTQQVELAKLEAELIAQRTTIRRRHESVTRKLKQVARTSQTALADELLNLKSKGDIDTFQRFWIINAVQISASADVIEELSRRKDVGNIYLDYAIETIKPVPIKQLGGVIAGDGGTSAGNGDAEPGVAAIGAPEAWELGITGDGVLVASLDTGVQGTHPALSSRWAGTANPNYAGHPEWAWFDPVTSTNFPQVFFGSNHGTHTMGTICGGAPGDQIGVAPGAQWIHAAVIDRGGISQTISDAIAAFEWMIDPDGDPSTHFDVPAVCCNSWGLADFHGVPDCDTEFWQFLDACETAGIVIVFAAGNEGGDGLRRPGDRATDDYRTLAVAAVDGNDALFPVAGFSSRGPTFCTPNGQMAIKPDISAPGVSVRSSISGSSYGPSSGTSMAAPHISGTVALMRQANPNLSVQEIKQILFDTATDLGTNGEDNSYGWGMVNAFEAVQVALSLNVTLGDVNRDGLVNLLDVGPFVDLLSSSLYQVEADMNEDGQVNLLDVNPFIDLIGN